MQATRKNESLTDLNLFHYISTKKIFSCEWETKKTKNKNVQIILDVSSKEKNGHRGEPDFIYVNEIKKLLIIVENKFSIKDHESYNKDNPKKYAVDGTIHYISHFKESSLKNFPDSVKAYFKNWSIIGIAFSGDIHDIYNHLISTFILSDEQIKDIETNEIMDEEDYLSFFENIDIEQISKNISKSSSEINRLLRAVDSQKRPVLLSALMICLYDKDNVANDFKAHYNHWSTINIIRNIPTTISDILLKEGISKDKISILENELAFIKTDHDLNTTDVLKNILAELENNVIPLFNKKSNYDIIGKFYEEFLRYAGVANVKKGIVLTPSHIAKLFTELIDFKTNDVILDTCCGTGAFLIAGMNRLVSEIENSAIPNKTSKIKNIKENQLIGFEKSSTMYSLAISNMLFRGDGKSRIYNIDAFSMEANQILSDLSKHSIFPSIGFINPPYGGKDNHTNPTKREIQFLEKMLDSVSRYGVIIAPLSTYFKEDTIRNRILSKHTLKYVINTPGELFQPNASTHTAIAVFETNLPHNGKETIFYDLKNDGFILSKNRGRTDVLGKWNSIKKKLLHEIRNPDKYTDNLHLLKKPITPNDEWIIQAHAKTDYAHLTENAFILSIKEYISFKLKLKLNLLNQDIDDVTLTEIISENLTKKPLIKKSMSLQINKWKLFPFSEAFQFKRGKRLTSLDQIAGSIAYISSTKINNGIDNYITPPDYMLTYKNAMTLNNSGSVGYLFYHPYSFVCSDHCTVITINGLELNPFIAIFLKPIIESIKPKYNFAREISDARLNKEYILLPTSTENQIDWEWMQNYIKSLPYSSNIEV